MRRSSPSTGVQGRLFYGRMLVVVIVVVVAPLMFAGRAYLTQSTRDQIRFHEQERTGIEYIRPVTALLGRVVEARVGAGGDVDGAVAAVDRVDRQYGEALGTSRLWRRWQDLLGTTRAAGTPDFDQYNQLTRGLIDLVAQVANSSNLILDPDLDSYYLMDVIVVQQPNLLDQAGQAAQLAADDRPATTHDRLVIARHLIDSTADTMAADLVTAIDNTQDAQVRTATGRPGEVFASAVAETSTTLARVLDGQHPTVDVSALLAAGSTLDAVCAERMDSLLAGRVAALGDHDRTITEVLVLLSALLFLLATGLSRALRAVAQKSGELRYQAMHDPLTGLPNRALILDRVAQALARARSAHHPLAVMFLDLDGFKNVNDTYGHAVGDQLLRAVSARLTGALRETDTIGRLGGDEFVVLAEGASLALGPEVIAERIQAVLAEPVGLDGPTGVVLRTHASIGIAEGLRGSAAELLRDADVALYEAKAAGKNCYVLFAAQMQTAVQARLELETELRRAVGTDQLFLVYRPTVDLRSGVIVGAEALLRWNHPTRGVLMPDVFVPVAEESGLIVPIGRRVLAEACRQGAAWQDQGHAVSMAVSLSGRQLDGHGDLFADVHAALADSGLAPRLLTLQITETALVRDAARSARQLRALKRLGLRVAIDNFGTDHWSLAHLRQFMVDAVKIDRSFIHSIATSAEADALIDTLVELGRTLGIETYAEGTEEPGDLRHRRSEDRDSGQGSLFARPSSPAQLEALSTGENIS